MRVFPYPQLGTAPDSRDTDFKFYGPAAVKHIVPQHTAQSALFWEVQASGVRLPGMSSEAAGQ